MNTETQPQNLMDGLFNEMNRVAELVKEYEMLPNNAGFLGASMMKVGIQRAQAAIRSGDVIAMLQEYSNLKDFTE